MIQTLVIRHLLGRRLKMPLVAQVEPTQPGFVAHAAGIAVLGHGDDPAEAVEVLKEGMEGIYQDEEFIDVRATIQRILQMETFMENE